MKILAEDLKHGRMKLLVESADDLWHLHHVIEPGDSVSGRTFRRVRTKGPDDARGEKRPMHLAITVEKVEYHEFACALRASGPITEGPEDAGLGSFHTFSLEEGAVFNLTKPGRWSGYHLERVRAASRLREKVLVVVVEPGEACIALVHAYGVRVLATVSANLPSKRNEPDAFTSKEREFYGDVVAALGEPLAAHAPSGVIVAGPGWAKDKLADLLSEARADLKVHVEGIGSSGETGVNELIKRGTVSRLYSDSRVALEVELVERLLASIAKGDGLSAYGPDHVRQAVECGAASHLLLTDELFRRANVGGGGAELDALMERAARSRGEVVIVSSEHEGGRRLEGLGGLAALLRYPLAWESEPDGAGATG